MKDLAHQIRQLGPWFHNLELGGIMTAPDHFLGDYPRVKWNRFKHAIPTDLDGATVLDIGCNAGFYAFEMKRRGAHRVVAIDTDDRYLAQASLAQRVLGTEIELKNLSVYQVAKLGEHFDLVLFLGVLYHLRYPLLALDRLREHVIGDRLVCQSMLRKSVDHAPRMSFVEHCYAGDPTNWWVPNLAGFEAMIRSAGLTVIDHPEAETLVCHV